MFWNTFETLHSKCNCYDGNNFPGIPLLHRFASSVRLVNLRCCPAQAQEPSALRAARAQARPHPGDNALGAARGSVTTGPRVRTRSSVTLGPAASAAPLAGAAGPPDEAVLAGCIPPPPRRCPPQAGGEGRTRPPHSPFWCSSRTSFAARPAQPGPGGAAAARSWPPGLRDRRERAGR